MYTVHHEMKKWLVVLFVKHFRKETAANEEMVLHIQTESKKLREIEEQLERENQDLKSEKITWEVEKKNLEERYIVFFYVQFWDKKRYSNKVNKIDSNVFVKILMAFNNIWNGINSITWFYCAMFTRSCKFVDDCKRRLNTVLTT